MVARIPQVHQRGMGQQHGISRRTIERVRAKMRNMGLIDHVSRFNKAYGCREGWVFSARIERTLVMLANLAARIKDAQSGSRDKDQFALEFAVALRNANTGQSGRS